MKFLKKIDFYCAYEVNHKVTKSDIVVIDLKNKLQQIKDVIKRWNEVDAEVVKSFCLSIETHTEKELTCETVVINGLVGYLSKKSRHESEWKDEYLCVNAKMPEIDKTEAGALLFAKKKKKSNCKNNKLVTDTLFLVVFSMKNKTFNVQIDGRLIKENIINYFEEKR